MSERDVYIQCIPMIAEMVVLLREMSQQEYEDWKRDLKSREYRQRDFIHVS